MGRPFRVTTIPTWRTHERSLEGTELEVPGSGPDIQKTESDFLVLLVIWCRASRGPRQVLVAMPGAPGPAFRNPAGCPNCK